MDTTFEGLGTIFLERKRDFGIFARVFICQSNASWPVQRVRGWLQVSASLVSIKSRWHFPGIQTKPSDYGAGTEHCWAPRVTVILWGSAKMSRAGAKDMTTLILCISERFVIGKSRAAPAGDFQIAALHAPRVRNCVISVLTTLYCWHLSQMPLKVQFVAANFLFVFLPTGFLFTGGTEFLLANLAHPFPLWVS